MAPPAVEPFASTHVGDIEDFGTVVVTQKCTGCVVCRVLAPDVFLEARADSADPTVRRGCMNVYTNYTPLYQRWSQPTNPSAHRPHPTPRHATETTQVFTDAVGRPLKSEAEFHDVRRAVMACPVGAIKWVKRPKIKARPLQEGYPKVN